jgi:hypothetical protein
MYIDINLLLELGLRRDHHARLGWEMVRWNSSSAGCTVIESRAVCSKNSKHYCV